MTKARLYDLNDDKIISLDASTLNTVIVTNMSILGDGFTWSPEDATASNPDGKLRLGDLTVTQIMDYTARVISFLSNFGVLSKRKNLVPLRRGVFLRSAYRPSAFAREREVKRKYFRQK